jgi:glycerate dehydrogenase
VTPRIVVLDAQSLNPGDLSWSELEALGRCTVHARTDPSDVIERARDAEIVLTNKTRLGAAELAGMARLRYAGVLATGHDVVDVRAASARGVVVANVPAYGTDSVAQMTFALLLELCNHVGLHGQAAREGRWSASGEFSHRERPLLELAGRTFGVVGLGRIGSAVAAIAAAFGMDVIAVSSRTPPPGAPVRVLPLELVLEQADVLSLHCPLTPATTRLIDGPRLARMRSHALLINTARGGLIDEAALLAALQAGRLGGAALDVLSHEPPPADHPLLHAPRCLVTPHIAWATHAARARLLAIAVANVRAFLAGQPQNVVEVPAQGGSSAS